MHILDLSTSPGLVQIAKRTAFIRQGSYQVVHLIDLNKIGPIISEIEQISDKVDKTNKFKNILASKTLHLKRTFDEIKPHYRLKRSWDWIGSGIKWMAGNPDAEDMRSTNKDINTLAASYNNLAKANNEQIEINKVFEDKINKISETLSNTVALSLNETFATLDILNLILNIDLATAKLEDIKNAIKLARINVISESLLENFELSYIKRVLSEQGISYSSTHQALSYLESQISYSGSIVRYKIKIPQVGPPLKLIHVEPIATKNKIIKIQSNEVLMDDNTTYFVEKSCTYTENPICELNQLQKIEEEDCVPAVLRNLPSRCTFTEDDKRPTIVVVDDGVIITKNLKTSFANTCGAMNHTISGSMLISFKNCTIIIGDKKFENRLEEVKIDLIPIFPNIEEKNFHTSISLNDLHDLHVNHRQKLETLEIERQIEKKTYYMAIIAITVVITLVIIATGCIAIKLRLTPQIEPPRTETAPKREELSKTPAPSLAFLSPTHNPK